MTTPNQYTPPDGAFTVGGGAWNYGQTMSESFGRSMFEMEMPTPENMLELLRMALSRLPLDALKPFQGFLGLADEFFDNVGNAVDAIIDGLGLRPVFQTVEAFEAWVLEFFSKLSGIFTGDIDGFVDWFQQSILSVFSWLPLSHLFPKQVNLLKLNNFDSVTDMSETDGWSWDSTVSATADGGGSAKVVCDGTTKFLVRDQVILVEEATSLNFQARVKSSGLTGSNAKIELSIVEFNGDALGDIVTVASRGASTSWATFGGSYKVPPGVKSIKARLAVSQATGGTVWFDNLTLARSGLLQMSWIEGLNTSLAGVGDLFQHFIDGILEALTGIPIIGGLIEDVFTNLGILWTDAQDALAQAGDALGGLGDLIYNLLHDPVSVLGAIPQALVTGLTTSLSNLSTNAGIISTNLGTLSTNLLTNASTVVGSIVGVIVDGVATMGQFLLNLWQGLTGSTSTVAKSAADVKAGAGTLLAAANGAQGTADAANINAATALGTADNAQAQAVANAAELAKLSAANKGGNFGVYAYDNFDYVNTSNPDPTLWVTTTTGSGSFRVDGSKAYWVDSGTAAALWRCRFKTQTATSYQMVSTVLDAPIVESPGAGAQAYNMLVGRLKSDWTSYVYLRIGYNSLSIWKVAAGNETQIGNSVSYTPKVGDTIQFIIGNPDTSDAYKFVAKVNGNPLLTPPTDSTFYGGYLSVMDDVNNTWSGMMLQAGAKSGNQTTPGAMSIFSVADNKGSPILGSGITASRSTGTAATISSGDNVFPVGWFSTFDKTPDLSYSNSGGAVNRVTASVEGWYQVVIAQHGDSDVGAGVDDSSRKIRAMLWKGVGAGARTVYQYAPLVGWRTADRFYGFTGTFQIYLKAGEWVEPGYSSGTSSGSTGLMSGSSAETWFSVNLTNRSYN